jgi:hypothetical protein
VKAARELYGVVVDTATFAVDEKATRRLRDARRAKAKLKRSKPAVRKRK